MQPTSHPCHFLHTFYFPFINSICHFPPALDSKSKNSDISSLDCLSSIVQRITTEPRSPGGLGGSTGSPPQSGSEADSPASSDSCGTTSGDPNTTYQVL